MRARVIAGAFILIVGLIINLAITGVGVYKIVTNGSCGGVWSTILVGQASFLVGIIIPSPVQKSR